MLSKEGRGKGNKEREAEKKNKEEKLRRKQGRKKEIQKQGMERATETLQKFQCLFEKNR